MKNPIGFIAFTAVLCSTLASCSGMSDTQQRTLSGAGIGAGVGVAAEAIAGGPLAAGALVGGGVGAVGGYAYDQNQKRHGD